MKKKYFIFSGVLILIAVISFGLGYVYAYINGLEKALDMQVSTYSEILEITSSVLIGKLRTPDIMELIEATEENGDLLSRNIISSKPFTQNPTTLEYIEISLTSWEKAKKRLQELRISLSKDPSNLGTGDQESK